MWKAATDVTAPALAEADDWETDPDFVNDISEHEQRWGPGGRNVEAIECKEDGVKGIEDKGVSNCVEEDGKHYPWSDSNLQNFVSILVEEMVANVQTKEMSQELVDSDSRQRVALLPSESCTHKESYVGVIQDKCNNNVNVDGNIKEEQLNEQIEAKEQELSAKGDIKIYEIRNQRPHHHTPKFCTVISHRGNQQLHQMNQSYPDYSPYKCDMCRNNFKSKAALQNHVNSHCGIKPHACKDCNSAFVRPSDLIRHIRYMHTREKPYKCTECDYASVESSKLRRHMRRHTGEPY